MGPQKILTFVETFPLFFLPSVARTIHASRLLRRTDGRQFPSLVVVVVVVEGEMQIEIAAAASTTAKAE